MSGEPIGSRDEFIEASFRAVQTPHLLTPRDYRILESTHPHVAVQARKKAAAWQQKADEAQRRGGAIVGNIADNSPVASLPPSRHRPRPTKTSKPGG